MIGRARLLLDEMFTAQIAVQLRERGHDVIAVVQVPGLISSSDEDLLVVATSQGRCVVTANVRDFTAIGAQWNQLGRTHTGIVHIASSVFPQNRGYVGALVTALHAACTGGTIPRAGRELFLRRR